MLSYRVHTISTATTTGFMEPGNKEAVLYERYLQPGDWLAE